MKLSNRAVRRSRVIDLSMTSMIDVVFLLLIFFMTTASFVKTERDLSSAIKVRRKSVSQSPSELEPAIVELTRGGDRFVYRLGNRELESAEELTGILRQFDNKADGAFVRVSPDAPFGMAAAAIQSCKSANFLSVSYVPADANNQTSRP